jgi:tRNA pseudouridine32 synthase/23S rRNA pseudouridine746 synthase/23S rRNA pseudouridine1911/1915/1917 synthase
VSRWDDLLTEHVVVDTSDLLVLNKPAGLSVTGERHDTDVVRIAADAGVVLYPAHRIDKVTSGAVLLARRLDRHGELTRQFAKRTVDKTYLALVRGTELPERGTVDLPLSEGRKNRVRVGADRAAIGVTDGPDGPMWTVPDDAVFGHVRTYPSTTAFRTLWTGREHTLLEVRPHTGRRHQIRVHLAWIGHPIEGDPLFDKAASAEGGRTCLHSWRLAFDLPWDGDRRVDVTAPPGPDYFAAVSVELPDLSSALT